MWSLVHLLLLLVLLFLAHPTARAVHHFSLVPQPQVPRCGDCGKGQHILSLFIWTCFWGWAGGGQNTWSGTLALLLRWPSQIICVFFKRKVIVRKQQIVVYHSTQSFAWFRFNFVYWALFSFPLDYSVSKIVAFQVPPLSRKFPTSTLSLGCRL